MFFELAHKMQLIIITAEGCQRMNGHICGTQIEAGIFNSRLNHFLDTGGTEKQLI